MDSYRITLSYTVGATTYTRLTNAIFGDNLTLEYTRETDEQYYRQRLSGKITFVNDDYDFIMTPPATLGTRIDFKMEENIGGSWFPYLNGYFYRTDCEINEDDKIIEVEPTNLDGYEDLLAGLDKEYDLIKLKPKATPIRYDKRPCLQMYALGDSRLTCILGNMWWEMDCNSVTDRTELTDTYHFAEWDAMITAKISGTYSPTLPTTFRGRVTPPAGTNWALVSGNYRLTSAYDPLNRRWVVTIYNIPNNVALFVGTFIASVDEITFPRQVTLTPVSGSGATGSVTVYIDILQLYARAICDVDSLLGQDTADMPTNDIADTNRNYKKVAAIPEGGDLTVISNGVFLSTPTEWGIYQPNLYYTTPQAAMGGVLPVCRTRWVGFSYWITQSVALNTMEEDGRKSTVLKDAYEIREVINKLLAEFTSLTVQSSFLYGANPLGNGDDGALFICPKSNVMNTNYTAPAQTAKITLRQVLDMLRTTYKLYWCRQANRLRIEHIDYFRRGGNYGGTPTVAVDLTARYTVRNGKPWSYLTKKYKYDKPDIPEKLEFGFASKTTEAFAGWPITMISGYNNKGVRKYEVSNFDADIDYMIISPNSLSKDGFAMMKTDYLNIIAEPITENRGGRHTLLTFEAEERQYVDVVYDCAGRGVIYAWDGMAYKRLGEWTTSGTGISASWALPAGTKSILVTNSTDAASFTLRELTPREWVVKYHNWKFDGVTDRWIQNGVLGFPYLQQYYDYDMPCGYYRIGQGSYAVYKNALGVSKNKTQEISFPLPTTETLFDTGRVVKTGLGNGKIRNLSINLSSRIAKGTLEYDTE